MNPWRLMALPWMAWSKATRSVLLAFTVLLLALASGASLVGYHRHPADWAPHAAAGITILDAIGWVGIVSPLMLLALEAHRLRLPRLSREIHASLGLYALLTVLVPGLLLGLQGGGDDAAALTLQIALGASLGMAYAVAPSYLGIVLAVSPMLVNALGHWLPLPAAPAPGFLVWAAPCTLAVWLLIGWRWSRMLHDEHATQGRDMPTLMRLRTNNLWSRLGNGANAETRQIAQRANWLQPAVDLHGCGPGQLVRSLRVALGGWFMPQTLVSRLRMFASGLAGVALGVLFMLLPASSARGSAASVLSDLGGAPLFVLYLGIVNSILAVAGIAQLRRRWGRANAELSLLALLPGLGDATQTKRALLRAALRPLRPMLAMTAVVITVAVWRLHAHGPDVVLLLLAQGACMAMLLALTLAIPGGVAIRGWRTTALIVYGYLLANASTALALPLFDQGLVPAMPAVAVALAVSWASLLVPLSMLGLRGWRGLRQRPHPFLANA